MNVAKALLSKATGGSRGVNGSAKLPANLRKIPAGNLHVSTPTWWLESRFHFSFAGYFNPDNSNFGPLRVLNDDLVKARSGFGAHPHRDAEIFSYIVDGELTHQDSMHNRESLGRGCVQYMSAGTGVMHSEMNDGDETCRFLQVWLTPDKRGHSPQYGSATYSKEDRHNKLLLLLGGTGDVPDWKGVNCKGEGIQLHQDANVFVTESDAGVGHELTLKRKRQMYMVCIEGSVEVNGASLATRDAMELTAPDSPEGLAVKMVAGRAGAHMLMIEMTQQ